MYYNRTAHACAYTKEPEGASVHRFIPLSGGKEVNAMDGETIIFFMITFIVLLIVAKDSRTGK